MRVTVRKPNALQREAMRSIRKAWKKGKRKVVIEMAPGTGKTYLSVLVAKEIKAKRVLFIAPRLEILKQAHRNNYSGHMPGKSMGFVDKKHRDFDADVVFASPMTMKNHLNRYGKRHFDLIVVDEAHHTWAASYARIVNYFTPKKMLGLTATPKRMDGKDIFQYFDGDSSIFKVTIPEAIDRRELVDYRYISVLDKDARYELVRWKKNKGFDSVDLTREIATKKQAAFDLRQWKKYAKGLRTLAFCCSIEHADFTAKYFRDHGVRAVAVHSGPNTADREKSVVALQNREIDILFSVDIFGEGVDERSIEALLMLRRTSSWSLWVQQFGRGLRKYTGKKRCIVIDKIANHQSALKGLAAAMGGDENDDPRKVLESLRENALGRKPKSLPKHSTVEGLSLDDIGRIDEALNPVGNCAYDGCGAEFVHTFGRYRVYCDEHTRSGWTASVPLNVKIECDICRKMFNRRIGKQLRCSKECMKEAQLIKSRLSRGIPEDGKLTECIICGESFRNTTNGKTCGEECRRIMQRNYHRNYYGVKVEEGRECAGCSRNIDHLHAQRKFCDNKACAKKVKEKRRRAWLSKQKGYDYLTKKKCAICKKTFKPKRADSKCCSKACYTKKQIMNAKARRLAARKK